MSGMMSEADMAAQVSKLLAKAVLDSGIDVVSLFPSVAMKMANGVKPLLTHSLFPSESYKYFKKVCAICLRNKTIQCFGCHL